MLNAYRLDSLPFFFIVFTFPRNTYNLAISSFKMETKTFEALHLFTVTMWDVLHLYEMKNQMLT